MKNISGEEIKWKHLDHIATTIYQLTMSIAYLLAALKKTNHLSLTGRQISLMLFVYQSGGTTDFGKACRDLDFSKPVMTRSSDALLSEGLVSKRRSEHDNRKVFVSLTERGRALALDMAGMVNKIVVA